MPTRREAVLIISALPASLVAWPISSATRALDNAKSYASLAPDRELALTTSDNLRRQSWVYAGQRYEDRGTDIVVHENEVIRLRLINDTTAQRRLWLESMPIDLQPGAIIELDLQFDNLVRRTLRDSHSDSVRLLVVRPAYQVHAPVAS